MDTKRWIRNAVAAGRERFLPESDRPTSGYLVRNEETGVVVREAVVEDAHALAMVGARAFQHAHASVLNPVDLAGDLARRFDEGEIRNELSSGRCHWPIALWNGETVGFAQLEPGAVPLEPSAPRPIQLRGLYVAPDWSGHGVGSALLEACTKLASDCAHETLWVRVWEGNREAVAFLRSWDFAPSGYEIMAVGKSVAPVVVLSRGVHAVGRQSSQ